MPDDDHAQALDQILRSNNWFMRVLAAVRDCDPPDWLVGGGVIRSTVWDHLHGYARPTPLADVDVVFFDPRDLSPERDEAIQDQLLRRLPGAPWQAKNQAAVHLWYEERFGHVVPPLRSVEEAVGTWPETATCVAVRLLPDDELRVVAPFGLEDLFGQILRRNPRRASLELFRRRVLEKRIQEKWPGVRVIDGRGQRAMTSVEELAAELVEEVRDWGDVRLRPLFGWRGFLVGRRVFGCCSPGEGDLRVWTKLPEPLWEEAMATPLARPHPFTFKNWLELRAASADDLEVVLTWLHQAYDWVRLGEAQKEV